MSIPLKSINSQIMEELARMEHELCTRKLKTAHSGVFIDVGECNRFFISCSRRAVYVPIHKSSNSIVFRVTYDTGTTECAVVKWCKRSAYTPDCSFVASDLADEVVINPKHYGVSVNYFHGSVVEIVFREFIKGVTVAECWSSLSQHSRQIILCQVSKMARKIHNIKS